MILKFMYINMIAKCAWIILIAVDSTYLIPTFACLTLSVSGIKHLYKNTPIAKLYFVSLYTERIKLPN